MSRPCQRPLTLCSAQPPSHKPSEPLAFLEPVRTPAPPVHPASCTELGLALSAALRSIPVPRGSVLLGIRPRGHPFSRSIFRCFQSLVVAIRSSGISGQGQALILASLQYPASAKPALGRSSMPAASRVCAMVWSIGSSCCTSLASWVTPTATMICSSLTTAWAL